MAAQSWGWVKLHTVVVGIAVVAAAPIAVVVVHRVEAVAAVHIVMPGVDPTVVVAVHRIGSGHYPTFSSPS